MQNNNDNNNNYNNINNFKKLVFPDTFLKIDCFQTRFLKIRRENKQIKGRIGKKSKKKVWIFVCPLLKSSFACLFNNNNSFK